jgi:hypothetical protein
MTPANDFLAIPAGGSGEESLDFIENLTLER